MKSDGAVAEAEDSLFLGPVLTQQAGEGCGCVGVMAARDDGAEDEGGDYSFALC